MHSLSCFEPARAFNLTKRAVYHLKTLNLLDSGTIFYFFTHYHFSFRQIVNMYALDFGEIVRSQLYVRQIYSSYKKEKGEYLYSSREFLKKLLSIHDRLGVQPLTEDEVSVNVKLPGNQNPLLREWWHKTTIKKTEECPLIIKLDRLVGYIEDEVLLATKLWIEKFESKPGDKVIISPCVPVPDLSYDVR